MPSPPESSSPPKTHRGLERGESVGRFVVLGLLGRGGMGEVYAAYDPELDRKVAVKLLLSRQLASAEDEARLLREAQAIAKLSHPNVVVVYDVGKLRDSVFIAMEFVDGDTLTHWMGATRRTWREILNVFQAAGRGLAAAHQAEMIHRDFKPDNVMLTKDGQVRVMDFGLARQVAGDAREPPPAASIESALQLARKAVMESTGTSTPNLVGSGPYLRAKITQTGNLIGTPAYMAPEQYVANGRIDARTDQFSFCVALYEALYGERPFEGETILAIQSSVLLGEVRRAPERTRVPGWIRRVLLRGLATAPSKRFPTMDALLAELQKDPAGRRRKWMTSAATALLLSVLAVTANRLGVGRPAICAGGPARLAGIWEPGGRSARKQAIRAVFARSNKPYAADAFTATARLLDRYADRWVSMYRDTCEATQVRGEQSAGVLDLRMSCLQDRLGNVRALTDVLAAADDAVVLNAVNAAGALAPLERCADVAELRAVVKPPQDPAIRKRVDHLREELARLIALRDSGQCRVAESKGTALIEAVRATKYQPLLAETLNAVGLLGNACADAKPSLERLKEAYVAAIAGHHDRVAAEAAVVIPAFASDRLEQASLAHDWLRVAAASIERLGNDELLQSWYLVASGTLNLIEGKHESALDDQRQALAIKRKLLGPDHPDTIGSLQNVGNTLAGLGRYDEALATDRQALTAAEHALGSTSPIVAVNLNNQGEVLNILRRHTEARAAYPRALDIWRQLGADPLFLSVGLTGLGLALLGEGKPREAVAPLEESLAFRVERRMPRESGETRFALARALWSRAAARPRALVLARQARADYGSDKQHVAEIDAWLARPR